MMKSLRQILRQMNRAADDLHALSTGTAESSYAAASKLILQLRNALEFGPAYKTTGRAEEFDYANQAAHAEETSEENVVSSLQRLVGTEITLKDKRVVKILDVGDYEPPDRSVGIYIGGVNVSGDDGESYEVLDNGDVTVEGSHEVVGHTAPLWENY